MNEKAKIHLKELKKLIKKGYGSKCKGFHWACFVCMTYMAWDILWDSFDFEDD